MKRNGSEKTLGDRFGDPFGTLIKPGEYRVFYRGFERGCVYGTERLFCWFTVASDQEGAEKPLIRVYNALRKSFVPRSHNIARDYYALTGRRPPPTVKPDDYLRDCEVLVDVATVNDPAAAGRRNGAQHDWGPPYSKVNALLKITVGTPPCLRKGARDAS